VGPGVAAEIGAGLASAGAIGAGAGGLIAIGALALLLLLFRRKKKKPEVVTEETVSDTDMFPQAEYISEYGLSDAAVADMDSAGDDIPRMGSDGGNYESDPDMNASENNPDDFEVSASDG
jgi:hypothetical protein